MESSGLRSRSSEKLTSSLQTLFLFADMQKGKIVKSQDAVTAHWQQFADKYSKYLSLSLSPLSSALVLSLGIGIDVAHDAQVLELGCGDGTAAAFTARYRR